MRAAAWGLLLAGSVACLPAPPGRPDAAPPEIDPASLPPSVVTALLADAVAGMPYGDRLLARDGVPPYAWSITTAASWLSVDARTGTLRGTPPPAAAGTVVSFTATAGDAAGRTGSANLTLRVLACTPGETQVCQEPSAGACLAGTRTCQPGGTWSTCVGGAASTSASGCGPACATCGPDSDRCGGGGTQCACGPSAAACAAGTSCCSSPDGGARCADLAGDVTACGSCGTRCGTPANADPTCDAGVCGAACRAGYGACDGRTLDGCEVNLNTDPGHCGSCPNACASTAAGTAACAGGNCDLTCNAGHPQHCGLADCRAYDTANCGGCNAACPSPGANASALTGCAGPGTCTYSCNAGWGDCNGGMDGCETDLNSTSTHCSSCGNNCDAQGWDGGCVNGQCARCYQCGSSNVSCCGEKCVFFPADNQWECMPCAPGSLVNGGC